MTCPHNYSSASWCPRCIELNQNKEIRKREAEAIAAEEHARAEDAAEKAKEVFLKAKAEQDKLEKHEQDLTWINAAKEYTGPPKSSIGKRGLFGRQAALFVNENKDLPPLQSKVGKMWRDDFEVSVHTVRDHSIQKAILALISSFEQMAHPDPEADLLRVIPFYGRLFDIDWRLGSSNSVDTPWPLVEDSGQLRLRADSITISSRASVVANKVSPGRELFRLMRTKFTGKCSCCSEPALANTTWVAGLSGKKNGENKEPVRYVCTDCAMTYVYLELAAGRVPTRRVNTKPSSADLMCEAFVMLCSLIGPIKISGDVWMDYYAGNKLEA